MNGSLLVLKSNLEQTKEHAARIEKILAEHKQSTRGSKCRGMEGIIAEGAEMIEEEGRSGSERCRTDFGRATGRALRNSRVWHRSHVCRIARR